MRIGFIPAIVKMFLLRKIGEGKSKELLLTGDLISAAEAKDFGLINQVVAAPDLDEVVDSLAQKLVAKNSGQSMGMTKQMIAQVQGLRLEDGLKYAAAQNVEARQQKTVRKELPLS